ncbi:LysR family transcriptional regulator [Massilia sp. NR 4-1]|uniref:LysR family transcriptional regulator n=1 Tax=Massilia sp. NR 4-1 TaxID=1678028 RepID=UPI00067D3568|nr:LysR family transcriptional regulator [Massilia sp. NR 4-1]AKU21479.1 LysR family transcriptional regulator [Massilia sp. NR 4-1]
MQQDLNDLYYFVQVVENGGFAPAGRVLGIPKSKLSRRIALLEERLNVRLLQRSTRSFAVTELGQAYYCRCKAMLVEADSAQALIEASHAQPCGTVRLSCPIGLLHAKVDRMLAEFAVLYPGVSIQLHGMNRVADVIGEGLDLALRVRPLPLNDTSGLTMRTLAYAPQILVASPQLVERFGMPAAPADLADWPSLANGVPMDGHVWSLQGAGGAQAVQRHSPKFVTTDMTTLRHLAVAGVGVVHLPLMMVRAELDAGRLVRLLPEWAPSREIIYAAFPSRRGLIPSVRALLDFLAERFAASGED